MSLVIFLLLWFLLPRGPQMVLKEIDLTKDGSPDQSNFSLKIAEKFWFKNNNYYTMKWSNMRTSVYLCRNRCVEEEL
jgi:hypothetical protein